MKNFFALSLGIILSAALISCQKEASFQEDANNAGGGVNGDFRCKINGVQWVASKGAAATIANGLINLSGLSDDDKALIITLTDSGAHRYTLNETTAGAAGYSDPGSGNALTYTTNQSDDITRAGGEINITSIDANTKRMKGTFSFRVYRQDDDKTLNMTEGTFDLSYTTSVVLPPSAASDTFRAKINGIPLTVNSIFATRTGAPVDILSIQGSATSGFPTLGLQMPPDIAPGEYDIDIFGATYLGIYNPDATGTNAQGAMSGKLKILDHNTTSKRIRGTFEFHAQNLLDPGLKSEVTEGFFSVKY